jgi:zinc protease
MMSRTLSEEKAWLAPQLASGALEVSVAGDIDIDAVIAAAAKTLGTLPQRDPRPALQDRHKVAFPALPFQKEYGLDTKIPKGIVAVYWPTTDGLDIHRQRRLNMLAEVLSDRLRVKVREQLGSTYAPIVGSTASDIFPGYGYITAMMVVEPANTAAIEDVVLGVANDIRTGGVTQDELDRMKNPAMKAIGESERTNTYWMTVLGKAQEDPEVLDWARTRHADFAAITKEELNALAKLYFDPASASKVVIKPYLVPVNSPMMLKPVAPAPTPPPDGM